MSTDKHILTFQVVTTKRSSFARSPTKGNNSSHSPFNDDEEEDGKSTYAKDIKNRLSTDNVVSNGDQTNKNISQNEYDKHSKNTALQCHDYNETWKERPNGALKYSPDVESDCFDPDIIPIKTKNLSCDFTDVKDSFKELSLPSCPVQSFPQHMSSKSFTDDIYKADEDTNTMSSGKLDSLSINFENREFHFKIVKIKNPDIVDYEFCDFYSVSNVRMFYGHKLYKKNIFQLFCIRWHTYNMYFR